MKGKVEEEIGEHTDDEKLEREGKRDQAKGKAKDAWEDTKEVARDITR